MQFIEGHGQVLLLGGLWKQDECSLALQNILEPDGRDQPAGPSTTGATSGRRTSSNRRPTKRSADSSSNCADCPAAKCRRSTQKRPHHRHEAVEVPAGTPDSGPAEDQASGNSDPWQPAAASERGARLLLVLCRASALRSQLPQLQLLLQQVCARGVVQPRRTEEAGARRRMETLLCGAFAVHTGVLCPSRPEGTLDLQRAAGGRAHEASEPGCASLVGRETQTDVLDTGHCKVINKRGTVGCDCVTEESAF
ncbi:Structural Maintenance Of Chromosomes Protein 1B [Manis pentadactyla]|nr:Structural Maintenance Of Chromosomes Protein 1B [Manis pentadactyla]